MLPRLIDAPRAWLAWHTTPHEAFNVQHATWSRVHRPCASSPRVRAHSAGAFAVLGRLCRRQSTVQGLSIGSGFTSHLVRALARGGTLSTRTVAAAQVIPGRSREELYTALDEEVRLRTQQQGGRSTATASAYEEHSRSTQAA